MNGDEEIGSMLRAMDDAEPGVRLDDPRAAVLHARIMERAARRLAELRQQHTWWDYAASWSRAAVPVGVAASILAGALWYRLPVQSDTERVATTAAVGGDVAQWVVYVALVGGVSTEMFDSLVGPVTRDALVAQLLGGAR